MKVNLFISRDIEEPHADIHTNELTDNITKNNNQKLCKNTKQTIAIITFTIKYLYRFSSNFIFASALLSASILKSIVSPNNYSLIQVS